MSKKVKRYDQIYSRRRNRKETIIKGLITALILIAIVVLTIFVAAGIFNIRNSKSQQEATQAQPSASSENKDTPVNIEADKIIAIKMPVKNLSDSEAVKVFAENAKGEGYNTVVVPLKESDGELLYSSELEEATTWNTMAKTPVNAKEIAKTIQDAGLMPMAEISAFEDALAGNVKFDNTYTKKSGTIWTDSEGQSWLNPYKASARNYICNIVKELGSFGYQRVLVEGAKFPKSLTNAVTGSNKVTQEQILEQFYQELTATQVPFTISYEWDTITNGTSKKMYGGDPTSYKGASVVSPIIDLDSYPNGYKYSGKTYKRADELTALIIGLAQKKEQEGVVLLPEIMSSQSLDLIKEGLASIGIYNFIVS